MSAVIQKPAEQNAAPARPLSLVEKVAARYSVEPDKMLATLKQTAFRQQKGEVTNSQMVALFVVADQYQLNPWTREIYAFPDKSGGIVPVVGVDGWIRMVQSHPDCEGFDFVYGPDVQVPTQGKDRVAPAWIECTQHRRNRRPVIVREYLVECFRATDPWQKTTQRMLRHKAFIQSARLAYGFSGIYDQDDAERIVEGSDAVPVSATVNRLNERLTTRAQATDLLPISGEVSDAKVVEPGAAQSDDRQQAPDAEPAVTLDVVLQRIKAAPDLDVLDVAIDLIGELPADEDRAKAAQAATARKEALGKSK